MAFVIADGLHADAGPARELPDANPVLRHDACEDTTSTEV
jgi:hypothetical protein